MGALSGEPGRSPVVVSTSSYSSSDGHQPAGVVEEVPDRPGLHGEVEALLLDGGADHDRSVVPGDEVAGPPVDEAPHGPGQTGNPVGGLQPEGQALDRPDRGQEPVGDARRAGRSGSPAATTTGAGGAGTRRAAPPRRRPLRRRPISTASTSSSMTVTPPARQALDQRVDHAAVVDLVVVGQVGSASDPGSQQGLRVPALGAVSRRAVRPRAWW